MEEQIKWVVDNKRLIQSTQRPTKEESYKIFEIANRLDKTQNHRMASCGRCMESAKRAIMRNLPNIFK